MATISKREWRTKTGKQQLRWDAQVYVGLHPETKAPQFLSKTFERKGDAEQWARQQESMKKQGTRPSTTKETLAEYLERWLRVHAGQVRAATIYNYRTSLNRWVLRPKTGVPPIGSVRLNQLTKAAFENLYAHMRESGVHPRGCQYIHGILRRALRDALEDGTLPRNPTDFAKVPRRSNGGADGAEPEESVVRSMSKEEADRFLKAARADRFSALWHVLLTGGLRPCEALALKWKDVDFEAGTVLVTKSLSRMGLDRKTDPLGWKLELPKTPKSRRTVPLPSVTLKELRAWRTQQKRQRLALGPEWMEFDFVFTSEVGTPLDLSNLYRDSFARVMATAGLGQWGPVPPEKKPGQPGPRKKRPFDPAFRIYDLRHTCATLLLMDGEDLKVVSERLGHSTIVLTADVYTHVLPSRQKQAAERLEAMFGTG